MAVIFQHSETAVLTSAQRTKFVTFISSIWPSDVTGIQRVQVTKSGADIVCAVFGTVTVTDVEDLPDPPFGLDISGSNYTYSNDEEATLTTAQRNAFIDFVQDTWSGVAADVKQVAFRRAKDGGIHAIFSGTKSVDSIEDLPDGSITILDIT